MDRDYSALDDQTPEDEEEAPEEATLDEEAGEEEGAGDDVEVINGYAVGFAFLRHYREHPEIGPPVAEQVGDDQEFQHAILHWNGSDVEVTWREYQPDAQGIEGGSAATSGESWSRPGTETSTTASFGTSSAAWQEPEKRPWWKFW